MEDTRRPPSYDAFAHEYEHAAMPVYRPFAKRLLQLIELRPGWCVLDAGTGTGLVALLAAPRVGKAGKVLGVDASEEMLKLARAKAAQFGFSQCEFRAGDLNALDLPNAQFNAAFAHLVLHHTHLTRALQELHRVLMPGGLLGIVEWGQEPQTPHAVLFEVLQAYRVTEPDAALAQVRANATAARQFRLMQAHPETMAATVRSAGYTRVATAEERHTAHVANREAFCALALASPALRAELAALPVATQEVYWRQAHAALAAFQTADGLTWAYRIVTVVAQK